MRISDILSSKGTTVVTIRPEAEVADLVRLLKSHNLGAVVVSTDGSRIEGIVSERDVVRELAEHPDVLQLRVSDLMTEALHTCDPADSIESVMSTMTDQRIRHLPVVVDGTLRGIVSIGDVVKGTIRDLQFERDQLEEYVHSAH